MPWLHGFTATAASDVQHEYAGGLSVTFAFADGESETVTASYADGLSVVDATGHVVGSTLGFDQVGSADELVAIAAGDGQIGDPLIALAVTTGGHRLATTSLVLYRVRPSGDLREVFDQPIEERDGEEVVTGSVALFPRMLVYRAPSGEVSLWDYDEGCSCYAKHGGAPERPEPRESIGV